MSSVQPMSVVERAEFVVGEVRRQFRIDPEAGRLLQTVRTGAAAGDARGKHALVAGLRGAIGPAATEAGACDLDAFWRSAVLTGCLAEAVAEAAAPAKAGVMAAAPGMAFVCGMLHDIGSLALGTCFPKGAGRVQQFMRGGGDLYTIETDVFGIDHTRVGKRLAEANDWPSAVVETVWLHHHHPAAMPAGLRHRRMVGIVALAQSLALRQVQQRGGPFADQAALLAADELGMSVQVCEDIVQHSGSVAQELIARSVLASPQPSEPSEACADTPATPQSTDLKRLIQFVERLERQPASGADETGLCRMLAAALAQAYEIPEVLTFALTESAGRTAVCSNAAHSAGVTYVVNPGLEIGTLERLATDAVAAGFVGPVPPELAFLEDRFGVTMGGEVGLFSATAGGRMCGGALYAIGQGGAILEQVAPVERALIARHCGIHLRLGQAESRSRRAEEDIAEARRQIPAPAVGKPSTSPLAAMAHMAAGAAHELNNPLAVIAGRAQLLRTGVQDESMARNLRIIDEQARRASGIVSELLEFAKPTPPTPRPVRLGEWADAVRQHWESRSVLQAEQIELRISDPNVTMYVDPAQMTAATEAIIANAIEATTPKNARLIINSESGPSDETIVVSFGDNGRGMTPEVLAHALDPFFSYRPAGRGRGLGLSRAARLLENNGGRLWIESQLGQGAAVYVSVPAEKR